MNTFPEKWSTLVRSDDGAIDPGYLDYFRERLRNKIHEEVVSCFTRLVAEEGLTKATLAKRLGKKPEQITRWLSAPGNWRLETVSDLLLAMNAEIKPDVVPVPVRCESNYAHDLAIFSPEVLGSEAVNVSVKAKSNAATKNKMSPIMARASSSSSSSLKRSLSDASS